jgi:antitoxin (DNA-binding transcriptional repressor) of toxin-antitoxin stability system
MTYLGRMSRKYSLYEAKSKLSELVRQVREGGRSVTITVHGRAVAELRAITAAHGPKPAADRHAELERAGLIHRVEGKPGDSAFPLGVRRPGALKRFLEERD